MKTLRKKGGGGVVPKSPGPREIRPRFCLIPQPRIDARSNLDQPPKQPDQIRQPIQIRDRRWRSFLLRALGKPNRSPFRTTANRPRNLIGSRFRIRSRQRPIRQNPVSRLDLVHKRSQVLHIVIRNCASRLQPFRRSRQRRTNPKQRPLNLLGPSRNVLLLTDAPCKSETSVQLIDRSVGFDAQVGLRQPHTTRKPSRTGIARLGCNRRHYFAVCLGPQQRDMILSCSRCSSSGGKS